ncbi:MAG: hypothetical protein Fur0010_20360 [Bdellovibrio sp.]
MVRDLKILFICFLLFSCQKKSTSQKLVQLIEENYANMVVNGETSKRAIFEKIKQFADQNELNFDNYQALIHQMNDGHLTLRKKNQFAATSPLIFHPGSQLIKECAFCNPSIANGKYEIVAINGASREQYYDENKWNVSASTDHGRFFRLIRSLQQVSLTIKAFDGRLIETVVPQSIPSQESNPYCVQAARIGKNIVYIQLNSFWCQSKMNPEEKRDVILQRFTEQWLFALKDIKSTDEIVLDVRENGGGGDAELNMVLSQFLEGGLKLYQYQYLKKTHPGLSKLFAGKGFAPVETAILPKNPAILKNPLKLLISPGCFSSCDLLARILKREKRALLIGEPTHAGVGDPVVYTVADDVEVIIPTCIVSSLEGEPYEGVEVQPDIFVTQELKDSGDTVLIKASTLK